MSPLMRLVVYLACSLCLSSVAHGQWTIDDLEPVPVFWQSSVAISATGVPSVVYAGRDGQPSDAVRVATGVGANWNVEVVDTGACTGYTRPTIAIDAAGRRVVAYVAKLEISGQGLPDELRVARDDGTSWSIEVVSTTTGVFYDIDLALDDAGNPLLAYTIGTAPRLARNDGVSWTIETIDAADTTRDLSLAIDAAGLPAISYDHRATGTLHLVRFDGAGWNDQLVDSSADVGDGNALAFDSAGNPGVSYYDATAGDLRYAHHDGTAWRLETVDAMDDVGSFTSLAFDGDDDPAIAYLEVTGAAEVKVARHDGAVWQVEGIDYTDVRSGTIAIALNPQDVPLVPYYRQGRIQLATGAGVAWQLEVIDVGGALGGLSLALDASQNPAVAYHEKRAGGVRLARHDGVAWQTETVDTWAGQLPNRTSLSFDAADRPAIAYARLGALILARYNGTTWSHDTVLPTTVGDDVVLAFAANGDPVIAFYDALNEDLRLARHDGSTWSVETVDSVGDVGSYLALAFDAADQPAISYRDATLSALKLARYDGSMWTVDVVDSTTDIRRATSLAFTPAGNPAIAYRDDLSTFKLRYAEWNWTSWWFDDIFCCDAPSLAFDASGAPVIIVANSVAQWLNRRVAGFTWSTVTPPFGLPGADETAIAVTPTGELTVALTNVCHQLRVARLDGCGDGNLDPGESCDDRIETATCDVDCTDVSCGDGHRNEVAGEECDAGGESPTCDVDCTPVVCGDLTTNTSAGEECDTGGESASCDPDCTLPLCGDGTLNTTAGEQCDDGNSTGGDGCGSSCQVEIDLCCVGSSCVEVDAMACLAQGGVAGNCHLGLSCSAIVCDTLAIDPLVPLLAVKSPFGDVILSWPAEPDADLYEPWYVLTKTAIPAAVFGGGPEQPIPGSTPTTVPDAIHFGAAVDAVTSYFYNVEAICSADRPTGACCSRDAITCTDAVVASVCEGALGIYRGDGSTCAQAGCELPGACCDGLAWWQCIGVMSRDECAATGGFPSAPGSECCNSCEPFGACCHPAGGCVGDQMIAFDCISLGGNFLGPCTSCTSCP